MLVRAQPSLFWRKPDKHVDVVSEIILDGGSTPPTSTKSNFARPLRPHPLRLVLLNRASRWDIEKEIVLDGGEWN